uniref:hypothetical protein n=1 Tax=Deinococcus sp. TaxID=47478 RepID=UPI002869E2E3
SGSVPISTTLTAGLYEENNASFMYSGSWTRNPDHAPSHGGGDEYASTAGDSMSFDFQGRGLSVYVNTYPGAGTYDISLDGSYVMSYNTYSDTEMAQTEMYRLDSLDPTVAHTVTLTCTSPNCVFDYAVVR